MVATSQGVREGSHVSPLAETYYMYFVWFTHAARQDYANLLWQEHVGA